MSTTQEVSQVKEPQIVTALQRLLIQQPLDNLFEVIHDLHLNFTLRHANRGQGYEMEIRQAGMVKYNAVNCKSPKAAVANALAKFFVCEGKDYHNYSSK